METTMNRPTIRKNRSKLLLALAGSLLALLVGTAHPAAADAPVITNEVITMTNPVPFGVSCPTFNVLATFTI